VKFNLDLNVVNVVSRHIDTSYAEKDGVTNSGIFLLHAYRNVKKTVDSILEKFNADYSETFKISAGLRRPIYITSNMGLKELADYYNGESKYIHEYLGYNGVSISITPSQYSELMKRHGVLDNAFKRFSRYFSRQVETRGASMQFFKNTLVSLYKRKADTMKIIGIVGFLMMYSMEESSRSAADRAQIVENFIRLPTNEFLMPKEHDIRYNRFFEE